MSLIKSKYSSKITSNPFLTIPFQSFEIENTYILPPQTDFKGRKFIQLCYKDSSVEIQDLPILIPPLKVHHYDLKKSMLFLEIDKAHPFYQKIYLLQEFIVHTLYNYQNLLFPQLFDNNTQNNFTESKNVKIFLSSSTPQSCESKNMSISDVRSFFQMPLRENIFGLYVHPNTEINIGKSHTPIQAYQLAPGTYIRALIRLYNILCVNSHVHNKKYLRIQHSIPTVWYVGPPKILSRPQFSQNTESDKCLIIS